MQATNIQQEGVAVKPMEPIAKTMTEPAVLYPRSTENTDSAIRRIEPSRISKALVTLASAKDELDAKQQVMAEQFRLLRTRVKAMSKDFQLQTMLVTSSLPGEGKTTVAGNLAGSLSGVEELHVLLVDFDLRRPNLHTLFGVEQDRRRKASWLTGEEPWQKALHQVNRRLDVLFGFDPLEDPDQLLQSTRLENLIDEMKSKYDVVVLDSAPMLAVSDTHSLVPLVDCALFVLNADTTPIHGIREALGMLQNKVAGCIVNRVRRLKNEDYYRNSGYGYGYGYKRKES